MRKEERNAMFLTSSPLPHGQSHKSVFIEPDIGADVRTVRSQMRTLLSAVLGLMGLCLFLLGMCLGLIELCSAVFALGFVIIGLCIMAVAMKFWLCSSKRPSQKRPSVFVSRTPIGIVGILDCAAKNGAKIDGAIDAEATESLMRSIRGIPYLIQAIQYSLETNIMTELGQPIGTSVIHTAPGCTSVLDCSSEIEGPQTPLSPRHSGPEEQWHSRDQSLWTNPQLNISLNRTDSTLNVFPYSESRPVSDTVDDAGSSCGIRSSCSEDLGRLANSAQSSLSRVTVAFSSNNQREIRCIGMSSAFLSRFNNSFKT